MKNTNDYFRVDQEYRDGGRYLYRKFTSEAGVREDVAKRIATALQRIGIGGRLVMLDGTPDGKEVDRWGGVDRVAEAKRKEIGLDVRAKNI